jgi:hypothetical protein
VGSCGAEPSSLNYPLHTSAPNERLVDGVRSCCVTDGAPMAHDSTPPIHGSTSLCRRPR